MSSIRYPEGFKEIKGKIMSRVPHWVRDKMKDADFPTLMDILLDHLDVMYQTCKELKEKNRAYETDEDLVREAEELRAAIRSFIDY